MEILKSEIIINSLKHMNNELAKQIKYVFEAEEYEILLEDIIYINKAYQNKQLKHLIKFFDKLIINNDLTKLLINKNNFNDEYREFIEYLEIWFKKHLNNGFSTFLFNLDSPINKKNNLIDFISEANKKTQLNEVQFNNFREIINAALENTEEVKILLSYIKILHLSHFFMLIDNYVRNIHTSEKIEEISILDDKNLIGKSKRGIYRRSIEIFISLLSEENIKSIQNSPFHNTIEQYVKGISYAGENNKEKENNSHFIQSAYLERIFESKDINYNGYNIKATKYSKINPYCKTLFYGSSLPIDSIEKRLKVVEVKFTKYLDEVEQSINDNNIFEKKSFYGLSIPFHIENKIIFLLNYIRTPSFVEDLYFSYLKFLKNNEEKIMNFDPLELAKGINNNLNHLEFRIFLRYGSCHV